MITTARDMLIAFLHGIQKEDAEGVPAEKFNFWINKAQEDWLTERSEQFDLQQKRLDDLFILRTERIIPINGSRTLRGVVQTYHPCELRLFSDGHGTFEIFSERYFSISGATFVGATANTGAIDDVTGEVTLAVVGDIFYAIVNYSEGMGTANTREEPVLLRIEVETAVTGVHEGLLVITEVGYTLFETETGLTLADYGIVTNPPTPLAGFFTHTDYRFLVPNGYPNPKYFRLLNVLFKISYVDNTIFTDAESNWIKAYIMKADQRADIYQNAYRFPTDEKPYYRIIGEFIEFINETPSTPLRMKIEYLRYPRAIKYVEPESDDVAIDPEFQAVQNKEIVDMAVRMYIEATQSPRYQTQIAEEQIKNQYE